MARAMHFSLAISMVLAAGACATSSAQSTSTSKATKKSPRDIASSSKAAIVRVETQSPLGDGVGTGFFITGDGVLVTNMHVVQGAADIRVKLLGGDEVDVIGVEGIDSARDLVLLRVKKRKIPYPVLELGDSRQVSAGDPVVAIGNPLGVLDHTVSDGLVSSVRLVDRDFTLLQVSAPISKGSSGGPLFNDRGRVIGVATAVSIQGQNLNFGVPSEYVARLAVSKKSIEISEFVQSFGRQEHVITTKAVGKIVRNIPLHDKSLIENCPADSLKETKRKIAQAIDTGAPLYNQGDHKACYKIYEMVATQLESNSRCSGVQKALGTGLLTAGSKSTYTEKAWAMRDAFDGLMYVIRKQTSHKKSEARLWPINQ